MLQNYFAIDMVKTVEVDLVAKISKQAVTL